VDCRDIARWTGRTRRRQGFLFGLMAAPDLSKTGREHGLRDGSDPGAGRTTLLTLAQSAERWAQEYGRKGKKGMRRMMG